MGNGILICRDIDLAQWPSCGDIYQSRQPSCGGMYSLQSINCEEASAKADSVEFWHGNFAPVLLGVKLCTRRGAQNRQMRRTEQKVLIGVCRAYAGRMRGDKKKGANRCANRRCKLMRTLRPFCLEQKLYTRREGKCEGQCWLMSLEREDLNKKYESYYSSIKLT
jgi:hypothetical protein